MSARSGSCHNMLRQRRARQGRAAGAGMRGVRGRQWRLATHAAALHARLKPCCTAMCCTPAATRARRRTVTVFLGGGTRVTIASSVSSMPSPILADARMMLEQSSPMISSISRMTRSGSAPAGVFVSRFGSGGRSASVRVRCCWRRAAARELA